MQGSNLEQDVAKYYANGFELLVSTSDAVIRFKYSDNVIAEICIPYSLLKSFSVKTMSLVSDLEKQIGCSILTVEEMKEKIMDPCEDEE